MFPIGTYSTGVALGWAVNNLEVRDSVEASLPQCTPGSVIVNQLGKIRVELPSAQLTGSKNCCEVMVSVLTSVPGAVAQVRTCICLRLKRESKIHEETSTVMSSQERYPQILHYLCKCTSTQRCLPACSTSRSVAVPGRAVLQKRKSQVEKIGH